MKIKILFLLALLVSFIEIQAQKSVVISPNQGRRLDRLAVTITGTNTNFITGSNTLQFYYQGSPTNFIQASQTVEVNANLILTELFIKASATIGAYTYKLSNPIDGIVNGSADFYVVADTTAARLVSVNPSTLAPGETLDVLISGMGTHFVQGSSTNSISFRQNGSPVATLLGSVIGIPNNTLLLGQIQAQATATSGTYDLVVSNSTDGTLILPNAITVDPNGQPRIVSLSPNIGHLNQTLTVTITGAQTQFMQGSPSVYFYRQGSSTVPINVSITQLYNDSLMDVSVEIPSNATRGYYDVYFSNSIQSLVAREAFEVTWAIGLQEISQRNGLKMYPNPARDEINLESEDDPIEDIEIIDLLGRPVTSKPVQVPSKNVKISLYEMMLSNSSYLVKVKKGNNIYFIPLLKE